MFCIFHRWKNVFSQPAVVALKCPSVGTFRQTPVVAEIDQCEKCGKRRGFIYRDRGPGEPVDPRHIEAMDGYDAAKEVV